MPQAEDPVERATIKADLEGTLRALQENYVKQRAVLLKDILPEVMRGVGVCVVGASVSWFCGGQ